MERETLLIKTGDETYTDVLNKMKSRVNVEGIKVVNVKKTKGGDLIVNLKGRGAAEKLRGELRDKMGEKIITVGKKNEVNFEIMDLDPSVKEQELIIAVCGWTGLDQAELNVRSLRENRGGGQIARVCVRKEEEMRRHRRIKVHWQYCRVRERLTPLRCYRCMEVRVKTCFKCLKHNVRDCVNEATCLTCKESGYRMDSMECTKYKELVFDKKGSTD